MPTLESTPIDRCRILLVGDPGAGKTTAIGHLLEHGQELFVADFDKGLAPIQHFVPAKYHKHLHYETLVDKVAFGADGSPTVQGVPTAFPRFVELMNRWKDSVTGEDFGPPEKWPENYWLVVDPLTSLGTAAMWYTLYRNGRMGRPKRLKDWGDAMQRVEGVIQMLRAQPINVIVLAHLMHLRAPEESEEDDDGKPAVTGAPAAAPASASGNWHMRYPATLGQSLPPRVGGYFTCVVQAKQVGNGPKARRVLTTVPEADVNVKVPSAPGRLPAEVPINRLVDIVNAIKAVPTQPEKQT